MRRKLQLACGLSVAAVLTACGGSGAQDTPPAPKLTSEQIHLYSVQSVLAGLVVPAPTTILGALALSYAQFPDEELECENEEGTIVAEYIDSDDSGSVSAGDQVNLTFTQCEVYGGYSLTPMDDDSGEVMFDGKVHAVVTEYELPTILGKAAAAPARKMSKASKILKTLKDADTIETAHLGAKLTYEQLRLGEEDEGRLDGTMRVRFSLSFPADAAPDVLSKTAEAPDEPTFIIATGQESGESLKISFQEEGKSYAQTITEFQSEDDIRCVYSDCDEEEEDDFGYMQHNFTTLQFANKGSDPELGASFEYRVRLGETLVPFSAGKILTDTSGETITTVFSASGDTGKVDIQSTGGATWAGSFEQYID